MYIQLLAGSSCSVLPRGALLRFLWNSERSHFFVLSPAVVKENSNLNTLQEVLCKPKKCRMDKSIVLLFLQLVLLSWNFHGSCSHTGSGWTVSITLDVTRLKTRYRLKGPQLLLRLWGKHWVFGSRLYTGLLLFKGVHICQSYLDFHEMKL